MITYRIAIDNETLFYFVKGLYVEVRLFKPSVGKEELAAIEEVFSRSWIGLGPKVSEFEAEWAKYIGSAGTLGVNSATAGLHLSLAAYRFPKGKKVLVPSLTFASSATCALYNGLEPVFVDSDPHTLSMCTKDLEKKITSDCVAIVVVHMGGYPAPMLEIMAIAKQHNLKVIEDCAHCAGGEVGGKKLGTFGDIGSFSFEEKKCMTTGDGGMLCSDDSDLLASIHPNRWVGIDKDTWKRVGDYTDGQDVKHWYYEISELGYKYNMNDLAACIGLVQLKKLDKMNAARSRLIGKYLEGIEDIEGLSPMIPFDPKSGDSYWLFGVRTKRRDDLMRHLKGMTIATGVHYMPLTMQPLFKEHLGTTPVVESLWEEFITLPLFPDMTDAELEYVIQALKDFNVS